MDAEELLSAVESGSYRDPAEAMGALAEAVAAINREMVGEPDRETLPSARCPPAKGRRIRRGTIRRVRVLGLGRTPSWGGRQCGVGASVAPSSARSRCCRFVFAVWIGLRLIPNLTILAKLSCALARARVAPSLRSPLTNPLAPQSIPFA